MKMSKRSLFAVMLIVVSSCCATANTVTYITPMGSMQGGENVNASAAFTTNTNTITIDLTNLLTAAQVHAAGQNISDLQFTISNAFTGTVGDANRSYTGTLVDVDASGNVSPGSGTLNGWDFSNTGSTFLLEELGSAQGNNQTIIGGAGASSYPGANSSITNGSHDPFIQGTAHFTLTVAGVTSATTITSTIFSFGTDTGNNTTGILSPVPEPRAIGLLLASGILIAAFLRKKYGVTS
jgi:hypothetical protein